MQTWRSLLMLADLTEYHRIGGAPRSSLSTLIHSGDAFLLDCKLRELVAPRIAQLEAWIASDEKRLPHAPRNKPSTHTAEEWAHTLRDWDKLRHERIKQAQECVRVLRAAGF